MAGCVPVSNNRRGATVANNTRGSPIGIRRFQNSRPYVVPNPPPNNERGACPGGPVEFVPLSAIDLIPVSQINFWAQSQNLGAGGADGLIGWDINWDGTEKFPGLTRPIYDGVNINWAFYWNGIDGFEQGTIAAVVPGNPFGLGIFATFTSPDGGHWKQMSLPWPKIGGKPVRWLTCHFGDTAEVTGGPWTYFRRTSGWPAEGDYSFSPQNQAPTIFRFRPFWGDESGCVNSPW